MHSSPSTRAPPLPLEPDQLGSGATRKPSLLPAFEPLSSSPFPRPVSAKRKFDDESPTYPKQQLKYYPTPVPTSSTGILPSSSPRKVHPGLQRTISTLSERQPLGAVPTVDLPADGEIVRMGRSSNSSDYQLSANRLISRVHVQAAYHGSTACYPNGYIEVECLGWNGAKIHCKGRVFELNKGDTYMSENPEADIMLDVQDTRVMIAWPDVPRRLSWDSDDDISPTRRPGLDLLASSPPVIPRSPVSQSPIRQPVFTAAPALPPPSGPVHIFEDGEAQEGDNALIPTSPMPADETFIRPSLSYSKSVDAHGANVKSSMMSSFSADDFSDGDEENDPVVHSFGPFGDNLLPRLASFSTTTPTQSGILGHRRIQRTTLTSCSPRKSSSFDSFRFKESPIKNHVINQLAFSRIHSQPLSAIHRNLPAELRMCVSKTMDRVSEDSEVSTPVPQLSKQDLKKLLDDIPCIGEIPRSGKDAAGQPLENEFYYVPEMDTDQMRQETVTGGMRGTGLRSVRKQHKQYYWKKPRV